MKYIRKILGVFPTKYFIDIWCLVALIRFTLGLSIDSMTLGIVLGAYTAHQGIKQVMGGRNVE
jgi:hypothetical protein